LEHLGCCVLFAPDIFCYLTLAIAGKVLFLFARVCHFVMTFVIMSRCLFVSNVPVGTAWFIGSLQWV